MSDDWAARSTAAGVVRAVSLRTSDQVDTFKWSSSSARCSFDAVLEAFRIEALNADGESGPAAVIKFGGSYSDGNTYWLSVRARMDAVMAYYDFPQDDGSRPRPKIAIISQANADGALNGLGSNPENGNLVIERTYGNGVSQGYYYDESLAYNDFPKGFTSVNSATSILQGAIDNGANPLTGNNPTTGAAWSAEIQEQARYGGLIDSETFANEFGYGIGDVLTGAQRNTHDEWMTFTSRIAIGHFGSPDSGWDQWIAYDGQPYRHVWSARNLTLGNGSAPNHTGIWLTPYRTHGTAGGTRITANDTNITGVTYQVCGRDTPAGVGVLEYDAATQRFRWHGNGESFGTAIGFSSNIDGSGKTKLTFRVPASGAGNHGSCVVITVNPASLPGSGTTTDNVTIAADARPTAAVFYKDFIESLSPINAPGGFAPIPAWLEGKAVNQWVQLPGVRFDAVDPSPLPSPTDTGPFGKIDHWTGFAYDQRSARAYCVAQGGHNGWSGNEVDMVDLLKDVPGCVQLRAPYLTPTAPGSSVAYYAANEPSARHGYYGNHVNENDNKIYNYGGSCWQTGSATRDIFSYDIAGNTYSAQGGNSLLTSGFADTNAINMCQDPATQDVYFFGGTSPGTDNIGKWTAATGVCSDITPSPNSNPYMYLSAAAYDSTRNRILILGGNPNHPDRTPNPSVHAVYDVAANSLVDITLTGNQTYIDIVKVAEQNAMFYVEELDRFLVRLGQAGDAVYTIHPTTWAVELLATTGGTGIPAPAFSRLFTKCNYIKLLGGVFLCQDYDENAWFLKLHDVGAAAGQGGDPGAPGITLYESGYYSMEPQTNPLTVSVW